VLVTVAAIYFLFPPVAVIIMSYYAEKVATIVEEDQYPARIGRRPVSVMDGLWSALKLLGLMLVLNLLGLPFYLLLFFATGGVGSILLYLTINGILLGREYLDLVALRHMPHKELHAFRRQNRSRFFYAGAAIAGFFLVPILNIFAPILCTAFMTHYFQAVSAKATAQGE